MWRFWTELSASPAVPFSDTNGNQPQPGLIPVLYASLREPRAALIFKKILRKLMGILKMSLLRF